MFFGTGKPIFSLYNFNDVSGIPKFQYTLPTPAKRSGNPFDVESDDFLNIFKKLIQLDLTFRYRDKFYFYDISNDDYENIVHIFNWRGKIKVQPWGGLLTFEVVVKDGKPSDRFDDNINFDSIEMEIYGADPLKKIPNLDNMIQSADRSYLTGQTSSPEATLDGGINAS